MGLYIAFTGLLLCGFLHSLTKIHKLKKQIKDGVEALADIERGNLNRRFIVSSDNIAAELCYKMNEIVIKHKREMEKQNESEEAYKHMVTNLSHDIRTPLTSLSGYLEVVTERNLNETDKAKYLNLAKRKCSDLKAYIDILFEWLKLDLGEYKFILEETDISEYTRVIAADLIPFFEQFNFSYNFDIPDEKIIICIDKHAYKRILHNFADNAVKHSNGSAIELTVQHENTGVTVSFADNGAGIQAEEIPFIFDRMYRRDISRRDVSRRDVSRRDISHRELSSGLGLAISKEFAAGMNGELRVHSVPGEGALFCLFFPEGKFCAAVG